MSDVLVSASFDDLRARDIRFFEEASKSGRLTVALWSDELVRRTTGREATFPIAERRYLVESLRWVDRVVAHETEIDTPPVMAAVWAMRGREMTANRQRVAAERGVDLSVIDESLLEEFPAPPACPMDPKSSRKKVLVTGCFDWFHSGHVRFFEEVSEIGDLYVVVGHDQNIRVLKGEGHPLLGERERCYVAGAVRFATMALVSSGHGWLDAEPEIAKLRPDAYAVNEDGDKPEKRAFCEKHGLEYIVLKRLPKESLAQRSSTALRGF